MNFLPEALLAPLTVPAWAIGAWRRTLLEWDDGEDRSTDVLYLQTPVLFGDIRIPTRSTDASEGFAGHAAVTGRICRWHRPIDIRPKGGDGDVGAVYRRGDRMIECGVYTNYLEDWRLVGHSGRYFAASRGAVTVDAGGIYWPPHGPLEILVAVGDQMIHAWRSADSAGVVAGLLDPSGRWSAKKRAGSAMPPPAPDDWTVWSSRIGADVAERILSGL